MQEAARATLPAWGLLVEVLKSCCRFSGSLPVSIWIDMQMPRTWYWKCRRQFLHCGGMHLCAFFPCVFCNYGRITNGLLSLHTHTLTENQFALHVIVASAVGCLPTYLRLSAQSLISINYGNCWRKKKKKRHVRKYQSFMARFGSPLKLSTNANHLWLTGYG